MWLVLRDTRGAYRAFVGDVRERDHLEELGIEGRIILNGSFGSWLGRQ